MLTTIQAGTLDLDKPPPVLARSARHVIHTHHGERQC